MVAVKMVTERYKLLRFNIHH